jgi:hypothetical protein
MGLKEILEAKKKAAEAANQNSPSELDIDPVTHPSYGGKDIPLSFQKTAEKQGITSVPAPKAEVSNEAGGKPLSFAEKIALKKAQSTTAQPVTAPSIQPVPAVESSTEKPVTTPVSEGTTTTIPAQPSEITAVKESLAEAHSPEILQAHSDILQRINLLETASETELEPQMKDLKAALMKNPSAVELLLDTDIGKMVIALRKLTKEAIVEAAADKKPGRKAKDKAMPVDAEQIARVFEEL